MNFIFLIYMKLYHKLKTYLPYVKSYKGILFFLFLFFIVDFLWKVSVHFGEGDNERIMLVFGHDFTLYTEKASILTAKCTYWLVHDLLGFKTFHREGITLYFENSLPVDIIWGCIGLKQYFMFAFIMCFYWGPMKKKLYYIPISIIILFTCNVLRQAFILIIIKNPFPEWFIPFNEWRYGIEWENGYETYKRFYTDWFQVFHRDLFTWVYYDGVLFMLWLIWEEKFNKPYQKIKASLKTKIED